MFKLYLLGICGRGLTDEQESMVKRCHAVVVAPRYRRLVPTDERNIINMTPVREMLRIVTDRLERGDVVVLAGGDPLFYGIGRKLLAAFGPGKVEIYPGVSSMQLAFARFREPWDDAVFVSLHGRSTGNLARMILPHRKVFVLTDRQNSPDVVAAELLGHLRQSDQEELVRSCEVMVGENLGSMDERLVRGSLEEIACQSFGGLNAMIIKRELEQHGLDFPLGLQEDEIAHSRGLLTKDEVRAVTLHKLRLPTSGVFWDIGAGSGSISIEAARLCPQLDVFAVERNNLELKNIRTNISRCRLHNISVVEGEAPAVLAGLPSPDRVFVGGSDGRLAKIIEEACSQLTEGGRIVVNGVIEQTREMAPALLHDSGLEVTVSEISVSRRQYPATNADPLIFNTIAVITGTK